MAEFLGKLQTFVLLDSRYCVKRMSNIKILANLLLLISILLVEHHAFQLPNSVRISQTITKIAKSSVDLDKQSSSPNSNKISDQQFSLGKIAFSLLPLSPETVGKRKTLLQEIVPGKIWTLDQIQGIINVNVPVRSTVIKLKNGGLFVYNPVAPTKECLDIMRSLEKAHGPVKYITLSTLGVEHKGTAGAFSSNFPKAEVFIQPGQYAFPINLPTQFFFPLGKNLKLIPEKNEDAPWKDDLDHVSIGPLRPKGAGGYGETAFYHRDSNTLLVTDAVVNVEDEPPAIIQDDPRALLYHARDTMLEVVKDSPANRRKGWRRMVLFGLTFQPAGIKIQDLSSALKVAKQVSPEMKKLGEGAIPLDGGLYPVSFPWNNIFYIDKSTLENTIYVSYTYMITVGLGQK